MTFIKQGCGKHAHVLLLVREELQLSLNVKSYVDNGTLRVLITFGLERFNIANGTREVIITLLNMVVELALERETL